MRKLVNYVVILAVLAVVYHRLNLGDKFAKKQEPVRYSTYQLEALDGTPVYFSKFKDQPVLLYIWSTWSRPSRDSYDMVERIFKKYAPKGLVVVSIVADENRQDVEEYFKRYGNAFVNAYMSPDLRAKLGN